MAKKNGCQTDLKFTNRILEHGSKKINFLLTKFVPMIASQDNCKFFAKVKLQKDKTKMK